jgi:hypothetical protein
MTQRYIALSFAQLAISLCYFCVSNDQREGSLEVSQRACAAHGDVISFGASLVPKPAAPRATIPTYRVQSGRMVK